MAMDLNNSEVGNMTNNVTNYSVDGQTTDGPSDGSGETTWTNTKFGEYLGYYKVIPELKSTIDTKGKWVVGKGYKAKKNVKNILDKIKGFGKDTFNTILQNMVKNYYVGGDAFAEIIKSPSGRIINLKPLDPSAIAIVVNEQGIIKRYEQNSKIPGNPPKTFEPEEIFHLAKNRFADEIHGTGIIEAIEEIILMRNEAMTDIKTVFHRYVKPLWIWQLDTDDSTKIAAFKAKADQTVANSENIYIPKGAAEAERVSVPQFSTLDPLPWIRDLTDYFYQATNTPDVIVGSAKQTVEASAKILYLAFQQSVEEDQLFIEEQIKMQLGLEIELEFPASIEQDLINNAKKEGQAPVEKNDVTATAKGKK